MGSLNASRFEELFRSDPYKQLQKFSDAILRSKDGETFQIHRIVLASKSEYFKRTFSNNVIQKKFDIPNIESNILEQILVYVYTNQISLSLKSVPVLLLASEFLGIKALTTECSSFSTKNIDIPNCLPLLSVAWKLKLHLFQHCYRFAQLQFQNIVQMASTTIEILPIEILKMLLAETSLNISSEETIWITVCTWIENDLASKLKFVPELLTYLNLECVDDSLASCIFKHAIVSQNEHCNSINELKAGLSPRNTLKSYMLLQGYPIFPAGQARHPSSLKVIINSGAVEELNSISLYVTFDEKLDVWQKICHLGMFPESVVIVGHKIYLFKYCDMGVSFWDLVEHTRTPISRTFVSRFKQYKFHAVLSTGTIYCIDAETKSTDLQLTNNRIERYIPDIDEWAAVQPMQPMIVTNVLSFFDKIYVFGHSSETNKDTISKIFAQVHNPETNKWSDFSLPTELHTAHFKVSQYQNKLLLIAAVNNNKRYGDLIEEYNPGTNSWSPKAPLPVLYNEPKTIISEDTLYIYDNWMYDFWDNELLKPPVYWDKVHHTWQPVQESSPMFHLKKFLFCSVDNPETVKRIIFNRKISCRHWTKSVFV